MPQPIVDCFRRRVEIVGEFKRQGLWSCRFLSSHSEFCIGKETAPRDAQVGVSFVADFVIEHVPGAPPAPRYDVRSKRNRLSVSELQDA